MVSLKKIAAELGISYTLVSKVLNGRMGTTGVSATTREAIIQKAKELDYRPNRMAVALKNGRKGTVAVFLHKVGSPGSGLAIAFLESVAASLNTSNLRLWLRFFESDEEFLSSCDENLRRDVDGLIVAGVQHPKLMKRLRQIDESGLPVVSAFSSDPAQPLRTFVTVDIEMHGYLATKHLLEKGCRRLAHFRTLEPRYLGFQRAHQEMKVPVQKKLVIADLRFSAEAGMECTEALLRSGEKFDGIVADSDSQGIGAVNALIKHDLRVPEDIKITGVDNSPLAQACCVPLTSVSNPTGDTGRIAVELLVKRIAGEMPESVTVRPELVTRESTR